MQGRKQKMARKRTSEFHKRLQGSACDTLQVPSCREVIEQAVKRFRSLGGDDWRALAAVRDHVEALLGAFNDAAQTHRESILARAESGEFKSAPQDAVDLINSNKVTLAAIYAEVDRKGIPDL
jgi:hypothetical protein